MGLRTGPSTSPHRAVGLGGAGTSAACQMFQRRPSSQLKAPG